MNTGISTVSTGAGFLPSTVSGSLRSYYYYMIFYDMCYVHPYLRFPFWRAYFSIRGLVQPPTRFRSLGKQKLRNPSKSSRTCKWLGSPPFISHKAAIWKGNNPTSGDLLTMVINHLLNGMILQVPYKEAETLDIIGCHDKHWGVIGELIPYSSWYQVATSWIGPQKCFQNGGVWCFNRRVW